MFKPSISAILLLAMFSFSTYAAPWQLAPAVSQLSFVSIKKGSVAENHEIKGLTGQLTDSGKIDIEIKLNNVESFIPIRNERMKQYLFNTDTFPLATLSAQLTQAQMAKLKQAPQRIKLVASLTISGIEKPITLSLQTVPTVDGVYVTTLTPILINSADFGLDKGIEALRNLASLPSIANAVPVSATIKLVQP